MTWTWVYGLISLIIGFIIGVIVVFRGRKWYRCKCKCNLHKLPAVLKNRNYILEKYPKELVIPFARSAESELLDNMAEDYQHMSKSFDQLFVNDTTRLIKNKPARLDLIDSEIDNNFSQVNLQQPKDYYDDNSGLFR